jgi:hypothetical protein
MGGFRPVPLDQLPMPQIQAPQYQPAQLAPPPEQPPGAGFMGKPGQIADIASNFLQGWVQGKQKASAHKLQQAQQSVDGAQYAFTIAQQNAAQVANDPNATSDQKQKAEAARQAAWKGYLDIAEQYTNPDKSQGKKKGGAKGAFDAIGQHLKNNFGTEDPHIFSQATMALLRTTGPPPVPQKSSQDQMADLQLKGQKNIDSAIDALADARKKNAPPDQIAKLEQNVRDLQGKVDSPKEKQDNALAQAAADERAGKPINDATKKQLQAAGYDPAPVVPNMFQRIAPDGTMYIDSIDPQSGKVVNTTSTGKTRVPPDQKEEAQKIFKQNLQNLGDLLKKAHPDWTAQQVSQAQSQAMLSGQFGVKMAPGMSIAQTQKAGSEAVKNAVYGALDDDERAEASKYGLFGEKNGTYSLTSDLSKAGGWGWFNLGDKTDKAKALDAKVRDGARNWLSHQMDDSGNRRYTDEQIDQMVPASIEDAKAKFSPQGIDPLPGGPNAGGGKTAKKEDVQAFADANHMSYEDALAAVKNQGYTVDEK